MESPNRRVLGFAFLIIKQWLQRYSIQLDLLKHSVGIKAIIYILRGNVKLSTYIRLILHNALFDNLRQD